MSVGEVRREYGTIVIVGGGCYGSYYVRQLRRAVAAGAITVRHIVVVDRDSVCAVAQSDAIGDSQGLIAIRVADWSSFFDEYLSIASQRPSSVADDAIVPSPLMPHLMGEWLVRRAVLHFGADRVRTAALEHVPRVPWDRSGSDATHYVSFATWMCPINCVEPRTCPETRGPRSWSMPETLDAHAAAERKAGRRIEVATMFCRHRAYGVGMFDTTEVLAADARIRTLGDAGGDALIGTVSHCHGALTRVVVEPLAIDSIAGSAKFP